jgi:hypothetical protein
MTANQLGMFVGGVVGFLSMMLILTSPKRMPDAARRRSTRVTMGVLALALGSLWIVNVAQKDEERILREFKRGCVTGCVKQGPTAERCTTYCDCELTALAKDRTRMQTVSWMSSHMNHGRPDAEFMRAATDGAKFCAHALQSGAPLH